MEQMNLFDDTKSEDIASIKSEFIRKYTTGDFKNYDKQVVGFIANILFDERNNDDQLCSFFRAGYCFYFANMLKAAFNRGTLCLTEPVGHIVWVDINGCAYDIEGPYLCEDHDCEKLQPIEFYDNLIFDFMHIPGKEFHACNQLHNWAQEMRFNDTFAVSKIWVDMPDYLEEFDKSKYDFGSCENAVYSYWLNHRVELTEKYKS